MPSLDANAIERVFKLLDRPLWIVTASDGLRRGGLVATWVAQASLEPSRPLVLAAIAANHFTAELITASRAFAVHLIAERHLELVWRFAIGSGRDRDKLADLATIAGTSGAPRLADCLAWLECRLLTTYDSGSRLYFWADVVAGAVESLSPPLCEQRMFALASDEQKQQLRAGMVADLELHEPLEAQWRKRLSSPPPGAPD